MNGPQLIQWRKAHNLTLSEVSAMLGDKHYTTISRWENSADPIPQWATEKLLAHTQITLPLDELHQLLDVARLEGIPARELIAQAIRHYLATRGLTVTAPPAEILRMNEDAPKYNAALRK